MAMSPAPESGQIETLNSAVEDGKDGVNSGQESAETMPATAREGEGFMQRLVAFRRTTLKAVPTFVLAIVAFLAAAGTAYAAYKVVTEVVIPTIEQVIVDGQGVQGEDKKEASAASADSGEDAIIRMSGKPAHALQFGEMLAMDTEKLPQFLESQGLSNPNLVPQGPEAAFEKTEWNWDWREMAPKVLNADLVNEAMLDVSYGLQFCKGTIDLNMPGFNPVFLSVEDMKEGKEPDSVRVLSIPLRWLDEGAANRFAQICGIGTSVARYELAEEGGYGGMLMSYATGEVNTGQWFVGFFGIGESQYAWVLNQHDYLGRVTSGFECMSLETVKRGVISTGLYSEKEWDAATHRQKAMMVAQAYAEDSITSIIQTGPDPSMVQGDRLNIRTGKMERSFSAAENAGYEWVTYESMAIPQPTAGDYTIVTSKDGFIDATLLE